MTNQVTRQCGESRDENVVNVAGYLDPKKLTHFVYPELAFSNGYGRFFTIEDDESEPHDTGYVARPSSTELLEQ